MTADEIDRLLNDASQNALAFYTTLTAAKDPNANVRIVQTPIEMSLRTGAPAYSNAPTTLGVTSGSDNSSLLLVAAVVVVALFLMKG